MSFHGNRVWSVTVATAIVLTSSTYGASEHPNSAESQKIRLVYRMDVKSKDRERLDRTRRQTQSVLQRRIEKLQGADEGTVKAKGETQLVVEISGTVGLEAANKAICIDSELIWYHAANVSTDFTRRRYNVDDHEARYKGSPAVTFYDSATEETVGPADAKAYRRIIAGWKPIMQRGDVREARLIKEGGNWIPSFQFSAAGTLKMENWSRRNSKTRECIAVVRDGLVVSIAPLKEGAIISDSAVIQGTFTEDYVRQLVAAVNSGTLPVKLVLVSAEKVPPR
jgi:preprotein translocase subunit SecD